MLMRAKDQSLQKYCTPVMFTRFFCALLGFHARKFPAKSKKTKKLGPFLLTVCLLDRSPRSPSLFIIGWCCSNTQTAARQIYRLCNSKFSLLFSLSMMVLVPAPPLSPLQDSPGFLAPYSLPVSSLFSSFSSSPSVSVHSAVPLQQRLVTRRPSGGSLQTSS